MPPPTGPTNNDPEMLARMLLGPDASPEEIAQMLQAISQGMPPEQPQASPDGSASDWTASLPSKLHPLGRSGTSIAGAGALAASPFLNSIPKVGPELAGAAFNGGLSALADGSPEQIGRSGIEGALGGSASRAYGPMLAGVASKVGPPIKRALGSNDQLIEDALAQMFASSPPASFIPTAPGPRTSGMMPEDLKPPPPNIDELLANQPVLGVAPRPAPMRGGFVGRGGGTQRMRPSMSGLSKTNIRGR